MSKRLQIEKTQWFEEEHFLYITVPPTIQFKIERYLQQSDNAPTITPELQERWDNFLNHADELLFPNKKNLDRVVEMFNDLCDAISFLAFVPGGVEIFGHRYEVVDGSSKA